MYRKKINRATPPELHDASAKVLFWSIHWIFLILPLLWVSSPPPEALARLQPWPVLGGALIAMAICSDLHWCHVVYGGWRHLLDSFAAFVTLGLHIYFLCGYDAHYGSYGHTVLASFLLCLAALSYVCGWQRHALGDIAAGLTWHLLFRYIAFWVLVCTHLCGVSAAEIKKRTDLSYTQFFLRFFVSITVCYWGSSYLVWRLYTRRPSVKNASLREEYPRRTEKLEPNRSGKSL